jgi:predicted nucleic acid-binding protein
VEKSKIICDTDVLIDYFETDKVRHVKTKKIVEDVIELDNVTLSIIIKMELLSGAFNKAELRLLNKNIHRLNILLIKPEISLIASELIEEYNLSHNLAIPDAIVAATAMYAGMELFTYNQKDFRYIKGLRLYELKSS